jgi:hypothetical protein
MALKSIAATSCINQVSRRSKWPCCRTVGLLRVCILTFDIHATVGTPIDSLWTSQTFGRVTVPRVDSAFQNYKDTRDRTSVK